MWSVFVRLGFHQVVSHRRPGLPMVTLLTHLAWGGGRKREREMGEEGRCIRMKGCTVGGRKREEEGEERECQWWRDIESGIGTR